MDKRLELTAEQMALVSELKELTTAFIEAGGDIKPIVIGDKYYLTYYNSEEIEDTDIIDELISSGSRIDLSNALDAGSYSNGVIVKLDDYE